MADILKTVVRHMDGVHKAAVADAAAKAMAEHCDRRIAQALKAVNREEKYLRKLVTSRTAGGVMRGDLEGAFGRLRAALSQGGRDGK